jgi:ferredoxin
VVAVNCTEPGGMCFCASMGTGPEVGPGYDLALTERIDADGRRYLVDVGSEDGSEVLAALPHREAEQDEIDSARSDVSTAAERMGRHMPEGDLRELLVVSRESPRWEDVASRCLTCGNCTMVCPTCFCTSTEDVTDLTGDHAERWMSWASCFEFDFTYIHGGSVRQSGESRYRHWITHKLGTWHDQFDSSGCVGCGRCIAWCPTGIDITEEMNALAGLAGDGPGPGDVDD